MNDQYTPFYNQFYLDKGQGEPIVLLHGLFGSLSKWTPAIDCFAKSNRVTIPRLPLFETQNPTHLDNLNQMLTEFLDWHQLADITLIGSGSSVPLALLQALTRPHHVKRLVLTACADLFQPCDKSNEYEDDLGNSYRGYPSTVERVIQGTQIKKTSPAHQLPGSLHRVYQPVLLIWGLQDSCSSPEVALHLHDLLPHSEMKFIDQCTRPPMEEHPTLFTRFVSEFLQKH